MNARTDSPSKRMNREVFARLWNDHSIPSKRICEAMGITRQGIGWWAKRLGLPPRDKVRRRKHDPDLLAEMYLAGVHSEEIAAYFGMAARSCVSSAAKKMGLPPRKRGASGKMNGGWAATITVNEFFSIRAQAALGRRMAEAARVEQAAMLNAEMCDKVSNSYYVGARHARGEL